MTRVNNEETQKIIQRASLSKVIILDIYHDRCESCKLIEPILEELKSLYSKNNNILFLKYDLSNFFSTLSSRKLAKKIGLEDIYNSQRYSGVVLIIDNKTKKVLDTLVAEYSLNKYIEAIEKAI